MSCDRLLLAGFFGASGAQNIPQPVVPFVARILEGLRRIMDAGRTAELRGTLERLLVALGSQVDQLLFRDVFQPFAFELTGTFERDVAFVVVREDTGDIGVAARRLRG